MGAAFVSYLVELFDLGAVGVFESVFELLYPVDGCLFHSVVEAGHIFCKYGAYCCNATGEDAAGVAGVHSATKGFDYF